MKCRHCNTVIETVFADLNNCPPSNSMLTSDQLNEPEVYYPLKVLTCHTCFLVQVDEFKNATEIFNNEYTYFSSYSTSWLAHAKQYVDMMIDRFGYNDTSSVIEIASNDGYLLQYFKERGVPVLGVEPTGNTAQVAQEKGIETIVEFFTTNFAKESLADKGRKGDLILGNNVLAHVPDINDFVNGMKIGLNEGGVITMEFPHLLNLMNDCQFDTIYHEHFSYLSFTTVKTIFNKYGLELFDVEEIPTHGGSLRIFAKHTEDISKPISKNVAALLNKENEKGISNIDTYRDFQERIDQIKYNLLSFLLEQKAAAKKVIGYGAAAKGNTLLNYCGVKGNDLIEFVVDASPHKQNKLLPASHIPVYSKEMIEKEKPDFILILPWNLKTEITNQLAYTKEWGAQFVTAIPQLEILKWKEEVLS